MTSPRLSVTQLLATALLLGAAAGCSTGGNSRANYLWSQGFGWHADDNPIWNATDLRRSGSTVVGLTTNHRGRPYLLEADLSAETLAVERIPADAPPAAVLEGRLRKHAPDLASFASIVPRSREGAEIMQELGLDRMLVPEPIKETTGSRLGKGVRIQTTGRIDPNTLPSGQGQTLNTP